MVECTCIHCTNEVIPLAGEELREAEINNDVPLIARRQDYCPSCSEMRCDVPQMDYEDGDYW